MAKKKGYKRGISIFLFISLGTFVLMFFLGEKNAKFTVRKKVMHYFANEKLSMLPVVTKKIPAIMSASSNYTYKGGLSWKKVASGVRTTLIRQEKPFAEVKAILKKHSIDSLFMVDLRDGILRARLFTAGKTSGELLYHSLVYKLTYKNGQMQKIFQDIAVFLSKNLPSETRQVLGLWESIKRINPLFLLLALFFWFLSLLTESLLLKVLLRSVDDKMPLLQCAYATLGNDFLTAITPFQSGGQPLMVYIMHKNNVSVGKGILITFFKTAGQIYFFALLAPIVILFWPELISIPGLEAFYIYGIIFFGYFLTLTFFVFFKPDLAKRITMWFFRFIGKFKYFRKKNLGKGLRKSLKEINIFSYFTHTILKRRKLTFVWLFLLTAVVWIMKFMVAVAVIWGLAGFVVNVLQAVSVQTVTNFLAFFAPSPGASGIFEFSMKKVFETVLENKESLFVFVVLWRSITYYVGVVLGGLVVVKVLKIKQSALDAEEAEIDHDMRIPASELEKMGKNGTIKKAEESAKNKNV